MLRQPFVQPLAERHPSGSRCLAVCDFGDKPRELAFGFAFRAFDRPVEWLPLAREGIARPLNLQLPSGWTPPTYTPCHDLILHPVIQGSDASPFISISVLSKSRARPRRQCGGADGRPEASRSSP